MNKENCALKLVDEIIQINFHSYFKDNDGVTVYTEVFEKK